jgi:hypothetical protein
MIRSLVAGLVLAILATVCSLPLGGAVAQESSPVAVVQVQPTETAPAIVPPSKKPTVLFRIQPEPTAGQAPPNVAVVPPARNPQVVCGLTMWQVDPETDPKIRQSAQPAPGLKPNAIQRPDFKIRRIAPTACRE